jgi:hypothetical protein
MGCVGSIVPSSRLPRVIPCRIAEQADEVLATAPGKAESICGNRVSLARYHDRERKISDGA